MTTEELAKVAYERWCGENGGAPFPWEDMNQRYRSIWIGVAEAVAAAVRAEWRDQQAEVVAAWDALADQVLILSSACESEQAVRMEAAVDALREGDDDNG